MTHFYGYLKGQAYRGVSRVGSKTSGVEAVLSSNKYNASIEWHHNSATSQDEITIKIDDQCLLKMSEHYLKHLPFLTKEIQKLVDHIEYLESTKGEAV